MYNCLDVIISMLYKWYPMQTMEDFLLSFEVVGAIDAPASVVSYRCW